ncbi:MAG TPA: polysaccharide biosynthesis tyrosine autokinase [Vicinamibacterales bacterium]|jgi:capsular exopolysaccharide synthesis family protein|nr:polysaccharide biosynthesis tyrosine autokinase [Vicinamibacterales bacterium]
MFDSSQSSQTGGPHPLAAQSAAPAPFPGSASRGPHLLEQINVLYKRRRLAVTVFALTAIGMAASSLSTIPMYRATARILIQDERSTAVGPMAATDPMYWQDPEPYYNTQHRILQSRGLARRVVQRLKAADVPGLDQPAPVRRGPLGLVRQLVHRARASILEPPAVTAAERGGRKEPGETEQEAASIDALLASVRIEPIRDTRLVDLEIDSPNPAFAAAAADAFAEEYMAQNLELRLETIRKMLTWLGEELERQRDKVTAGENALAEYRSSQNALSLDDRQNLVVSRLNALNDAVTRARTTRVQKETLHQQLRARSEGGDTAASSPPVAESGAIQDLKGRLSELLGERARLSSRYGPKHPEIAKLDTAIHDAREQMRDETAKVVERVRKEFLAAAAEEQSLSRSLEEQKTAAVELDRKSATYTVLQRQVESDRKVYEQLLQQEKELRVVSNSRANNVQIVDRAEVPGAPYTPNSRRDLFMALIAGLTVALGLVFGIEAVDDSVKTPEDVTRRLRIPLLGIVPAVRGGRAPFLTDATPQPFGEAFRALRTSLVFTSGGESTRTILVTSSQPLEGKTTTACNLAVALALGGSRVLLIDADLRRPGLHETLQRSAGGPRRAIARDEPGLSHLLVGLAELGDVIQESPQPNLFIIPAGRTPPNPSELLASDRMRDLLKEKQLEAFDWVILDTPPVLPVTDAVVLAQVVSGVVFVVGAELTRRVQVERALDTLRATKARLIGGVLNRVDLLRNKYYYMHYYGYGDGYSSARPVPPPVRSPSPIRVRIRVPDYWRQA